MAGIAGIKAETSALAGGRYLSFQWSEIIARLPILQGKSGGSESTCYVLD